MSRNKSGPRRMFGQPRGPGAESVALREPLRAKEGQMASRQSKLVFGLAGVVLLVILGVVAVVIANSQSNDRADIEERFSRRPQVSAALTSALFSATSTTPKQQRTSTAASAGLIVSQDVLTDENRRGNNLFKAIVDKPGQRARRVVGRASRSRRGAEVGTRATCRPSSTASSRWRSPTSSTSEEGEPMQLFAQPIDTEYGRRVLITGFAPELLYGFLSANLKELVEITGGQAYIVDSAGAVVASSDLALEAGAPVPVPGLIEAIDDTHVGPLPATSTSRRPRSRTRPGRSSRRSGVGACSPRSRARTSGRPG